jgi:hypothetical protein
MEKTDQDGQKSKIKGIWNFTELTDLTERISDYNDRGRIKSMTYTGIGYNSYLQGEPGHQHRLLNPEPVKGWENNFSFMSNEGMP